MKRPLAMVALATAIVMMGWLAWHGSGGMNSGDMALDGLIQGETVTLTGHVYDVQEHISYGTSRLWIYLDSIIIEKQDASEKEAVVSYHIICQTDSEYRPRLGSRIRVTGQFEPFSQATNPGEFDAQVYYASLNIGGMLKKAEVTAAGSNYSVIKEALYSLREYWKKRLYRYFPEKEASVLSAMLLGDRTQLDEETKELYMQNGIIHILSISGLHITLIGMGIYKLLRRGGCPIAAAALAGGFILFLYGIMTGMGVSAIRAIGMYLIRMLGEILGRTYDMLTALGFMGLVMLAGRPEYLSNVGFLLSFGSLCGIGGIMPALAVGDGEERRADLGGKDSGWLKVLLHSFVRYVRRAALPGIAVTLTTLPIQLYYYYEIPVYSIFLNLLVLPFMGILMVVGMIVMIVPGMFVAAKLDVLILGGFEWLCRLFGELPYHTWNPGAPEIWQIIVYYVLLVCSVRGMVKVPGSVRVSGSVQRPGSVHVSGSGKVVYRVPANCRWQRILRIVILFIAMLLLGWRGRAQLSVTFLDVGQGDGICVQTEKETYLFDCGSSSEKAIGEYVLIPYLKHEGISRLDGVFVTHPDNDHISGILELLALSEAQGITIERLILPDLTEERMESEFADLFEAVADMEEGKPEVITMSRGTFWQSGEVLFTCLHPPADSEISDSNAYSQCFLVEYEDFSMLLTGDVEGEGEELLMQELKKQEVGEVDLLKVAHHGSKYSTGEALLEMLQPDIAVISCGENNSYGHPHEEILQRLDEVESKIFTTPQCGAITVEISKRMKVTSFLEKTVIDGCPTAEMKKWEQ